VSRRITVIQRGAPAALAPQRLALAARWILAQAAQARARQAAQKSP